MSADIRVALSLMATSSGLGSITSLIYALSQLENAGSSAAVAGTILEGAFQPMVGVMLAAAGEALAFDSALKSIVGSAADIEFTSAQMNLALHGSAADMQKLDDATIQWASDSLYTTAQVHQLVTALAEHGLSTEQILNGVGQAAIQLGEAINTDPVQAANLLASTLNMFSSQGLTATDAANMLTAAFYNGIPSAEELQQAYDMAGGQMVAAGGTAQDLTATLDLLAQAGLSGSSAGASLRYVLQSLTAPTKAQADAMNFLGLTVVNKTSPAFRKLSAELLHAGGAAAKSAKDFDGTDVGLRNMFTQAQKLHLIPLNETFNEWATASGAMSTKFYDAKGQFAGLGKSIGDILDAIQKKAHGNKDLELNLIESMFNVRSGRAIGILNSMKDYKNKYNNIIKEIGKTKSSKDASDLLNTLNGRWKEFQTTLHSFAGGVGKNVSDLLKGIVQHLNDFVGALSNKKNKGLQEFLGNFVTIGAILAPLVVIIGGLIILFTLFGEILVPFGIALAAIPAVAALVAGFFQAIHTKGNPLHDLFQKLTPLIQLIGKYFGMLGDIWQKQILPALQPLLPILKIIAIIIGVVLLVALGLAVGMFLIIIGVITLVVLIIAKLVQGIGWLIGHIGDAWNWIKTHTKEAWDHVVNGIKGAWKWIQDTVHKGVEWVKNKVHEFVQKIVGFFSWLYHHNYYFQRLVDFIHRAFKWIHDKAIEIWNKVKDFLGKTWEGIKTHVSQAVDWVKTHLGQVWDNISTKVHQIWDNITSFLGGLKDKIGTAIQNGVIKPLKTAFDNLVKGATDWGKNLIQNFINGIKNMAGAVGQAAGGIAGTVGKFLGFHSPTEEGPGSEADQWAPNFMKMYAKGLTSNIGLVSNAASGVAGAIRGGLAVPGGVTGGAGGGTQVYNVNVGNQPLFQMVMNQLTGQLQINGFGRQWR